MKGLGILYKKMKQYFLKNIYFFIFCQNFQKITFLLTTSVLLAVEGYSAYQVKGIDVLYKKIKCYFRKRDFEKFRRNFRKKDILLAHSSLFNVK